MKILDLSYEDVEGKGDYILTLKDRDTNETFTIKCQDAQGEVLIIGPRQEHIPMKIGQSIFRPKQ